MMQITIDPRMELLAIIQYLADSKMVRRDGHYAGAIEKWFFAQKNHPVWSGYGGWNNLVMHMISP